MGDRDSELAVVVLDTDEIMIQVNQDQPYSVGHSVYNLRMRLWNEHLGYDLNDDRLSDPVEGARQWKSIAAEVCFPCQS